MGAARPSTATLLPRADCNVVPCRQVDGHASGHHGLVRLRQRLPGSLVEQREHVTERLTDGFARVAAGERLGFLVHVADRASSVGRDECFAQMAQHDVHAIHGHDGAAAFAHQVAGQQAGKQEEGQSRQVLLNQLEAVRGRLPIVDVAEGPVQSAEVKMEAAGPQHQALATTAAKKNANGNRSLIGQTSIVNQQASPARATQIANCFKNGSVRCMEGIPCFRHASPLGSRCATRSIMKPLV